MQSNVHRSFTPVWRWLCLAYVCLGVVVLTGGLRLGVWLPGHLPSELCGLIWLMCAAGTWQGGFSGVRGACAILPPAVSTLSYAADWLFVVTAQGSQPGGDLTDLSQAVLWGSVCMMIAALTRLDGPRG